MTGNSPTTETIPGKTFRFVREFQVLYAMPVHQAQVFVPWNFALYDPRITPHDFWSAHPCRVFVFHSVDRIGVAGWENFLATATASRDIGARNIPLKTVGILDAVTAN